MRRLRFRKRWALAALLVCACALLGACRSADAPEGAPGGARVLLDGADWDGAPVSPGAGDGLRVIVALDGEALMDLPFSEAHTVEVLQADGADNVVELTGGAVFMREANCDNRDCVDMGEITRDNLETRVMGSFIICLPHRLSVEVRGG